MSSSIILPIAYLAPVSYYARMLAYPQVYVEQWEHYVKQTYRTRCVIASESGALSLSIPVEKVPHGAPIKDVRLSDHGNWRRLHWQALLSAYDRSPFFEYYADDIRPFYEKRIDYLLDFNEGLRQTICNLIGMSPAVALTSHYYSEGEAADGRMDFTPKTLAPVPGFTAQPYYQVFADRHGFQPDLSIADLLFNMGPESILVLRKSFKR